MASRQLRRALAAATAAMLIAACTAVPPSTGDASPSLPVATVGSSSPTAAASTPGPASDTDGPVARGYHAVVGLGEAGVLLFGGETAPPPAGGEGLIDSWLLEPSGGWRRAAFEDSPSTGSAIAFDSGSNLVVVLGEFGPPGFTDAPGTWTFDPSGERWSKIVAENPPGDTFGSAMAYDAESDRIVMFNRLAQTWALDVDAQTWRRMDPKAAPPGRTWHAMAYDAQSDRVVLFGGSDTSEKAIGDTWSYDLNSNTWTEHQPAGRPGARFYSAMVYEPGADRAILFGGAAGPFLQEEPFGDTWAFDFEADAWTNLSPASEPSARGWHSMAYDARSDRVVLFGGGPDRDHFQRDTWLYDAADNAWEEMTDGPMSATVRLSGAHCVFDDGDLRLAPGPVRIAVVNETAGLAGFDMWRIADGHTYDELEEHIEKEIAAAEAGQPGLGHPGFVGDLIRVGFLDAGEAGALSGTVRAGTYGIVCVRTFEEVGEPRPAGLVGPIDVE